MSQIKLILDTRDAIKISGNTNNVRFSVGDQVRDLSSINFIKAISAEIPNTAYQITNRNNTVVFNLYTPLDVVIGVITVNLGPGHYSLTEFVDALKSALDVDPLNTDTYTVETDPITDLLTITNNSGNKIVFDFEASTMGRVMGFRQSTPVDKLPLTATSSVTSDTLVDLRGVTTLLVRSNITQKAIRYSSSSGVDTNSFIAYIPMSEPYGKSVFYKNNEPNDLITNVNNIPSTIDLSLVTRDGQTLVDINNFDWKLVLLISYNEL